jgi:hypothetical protein
MNKITPECRAIFDREYNCYTRILPNNVIECYNKDFFNKDFTRKNNVVDNTEKAKLDNLLKQIILEQIEDSLKD